MLCLEGNSCIEGIHSDASKCVQSSPLLMVLFLGNLRKGRSTSSRAWPSSLLRAESVRLAVVGRGLPPGGLPSRVCGPCLVPLCGRLQPPHRPTQFIWLSHLGLGGLGVMEDSMRGFGAVKINDLPFCICWSKFSEDYRVGKQAFVCNSYKLSLEELCIDCICMFMFILGTFLRTISLLGVCVCVCLCVKTYK